MDRWAGDPGFREAMRSDPEGAVRDAGVELDESEWSALRDIDWALEDHELEARASRSYS
jgi:hypothetical protein